MTQKSIINYKKQVGKVASCALLTLLAVSPLLNTTEKTVGNRSDQSLLATLSAAPLLNTVGAPLK